MTFLAVEQLIKHGFRRFRRQYPAAEGGSQVTTHRHIAKLALLLDLTVKMRDNYTNTRQGVTGGQPLREVPRMVPT